jgi:hypothetical protein
MLSKDTLTFLPTAKIWSPPLLQFLLFDVTYLNIGIFLLDKTYAEYRITINY